MIHVKAKAVRSRFISEDLRLLIYTLRAGLVGKYETCEFKIFISPSNDLREGLCCDQSKKQRDGERWRRRKLNRKQRVNRCRKGPGTNSVKQTRRDAHDATVVKFLPSLFSYRINGCMHFFFLLKLILNRRNCDS